MHSALSRATGLAAAALLAACAGRSRGAAAPDESLVNPRADATVPARRYEISYALAFTEPATHLYDVTIAVGRLQGGALDLELPVWSPGRYARMDFARNVQGFAATAADGRALAWEKTGGSRWRVTTGGADRVRVRYRVFANNLSGTFSVLDTLHANWNGAGLFMYVVGHKPDPVSLAVVAPEGWQLVNGASESTAQRAFRFDNYDILVDTPTEVAPAIDIDSFRVDGILYRVATHHNGDQRGQRARFVRDHERIVRYENRVFGPPPITMYTFLQNIGFQGGDGMEHLTSTQIMHPRRWAETDTVLPGVGTAAHEYFHVWNVKRVRPRALGPFDYTESQFQPSLWVAEGWTNYYGAIGLHRAGIIDKTELYGDLGDLLRANLESPGRKERSARQASFDAPFFDGAAAPMQTNARNTFFTYYVKGQGLALFLDLDLRGRSGGTKSLDDVLRLLRDRTWGAPNASYYLQGRGYTEADVERAVSDVAGTDMHPWFERYVAGTEDLPFSDALARAGLRLTVTGDGASRSYVVAEDPSATADQVRVREGWLAGR